MQATYGIGGHGLLLAPSAAYQVMVTDDRDLLILSGEREVARITPGDVPASAAATWFSSGMARFGEGGPVLELAAGAELEAVFLRIDTGMPHVEWSALTAGVIMELPIDVVLVPATPGDADPYFELHAREGRDEFISFMPRPVSAEEVVINPAPYQRLVNQGTFDDDIPFTECAYEHDGVRWRQIFYAVPLGDAKTVVVRAQASESRVGHLFGAAQAAAATLVSMHR